MSSDTGSVRAAPIPSTFRGTKVLGACDNYTPESSGGAEKAAHEIYSRLGAAGGRVRVLSVPHGPPYADVGVEVLVAKGLDLSKLVGGYIGISPQTFRLASGELRAARPDVLHGNTIHYNGCIALAHIARRHGIPYVVTAQLGPITEMPFATRVAAGAYERSIGRYILHSAARVLAVSTTVREHVIDLGARPDRVSVVENGVDHGRFASASLETNDDPLILAIGRIVDNKGPQLLVDAAIKLADKGLRPRIGFLGDGPLRHDLEGRVREAGLSESVKFHGQVRDVERWLARADIVVRASFTEGLPLAVLEAMSAARCNVVSDIPPNRELIEHGVSGLCFRTGDSTDLSAQLQRVLTDGDLRLRLAEAGHRASLTRSWDRMAAETATAMCEELGR